MSFDSIDLDLLVFMNRIDLDLHVFMSRRLGGDSNREILLVLGCVIQSLGFIS